MSHTLKNGAELTIIICGNDETLGLGRGNHEGNNESQWDTIYTAVERAEAERDAFAASDVDSSFDDWNGGKYSATRNWHNSTSSTYVKYFLTAAEDEDGEEIEITAEDEAQAEAIAEGIAEAFDAAHDEATA
jgi:hypothetical protein